MNESIVWVVIKLPIHSKNFEIVGIFSTEKKAFLISVDDHNCVIGPINIDKIYPNERIEWEGMYRPFDHKDKKFNNVEKPVPPPMRNIYGEKQYPWG